MVKDHDTTEPAEEIGDLSAIDGELVEGEDEGYVDTASESEIGRPALPPSPDGNQRAWLHFVLLPTVFMTVALLGGLRIAAPEGEFVFVRPALICLVFAVILTVLFVRTGLISVQGWFSESIPTLGNIANGAVLLSLFAASVQMFNSLIPEQGLAFWVVSFCFLWTLGVSFFTVADPAKLVRSVVALFSLAFLTKYFILLNLTSTSSGTWLQRLWDDPTKEALTYLLDLPRYASATGYIQFFAAGLFLLGLFLVRPDTRSAIGEN